MAKGKFDFIKYANYGQDEQGRIRMFSDDQIKQFNAENEAKRKIEETNALKQKIADESYAIISQAQKEKAGFERMAKWGNRADPRNWARGLFNAVTSNVQENIIGGGKAIGEQNAATNLYNQSKDLADQAAKIVKTDRPQAEALLKQSQALAEEANKFAQGEATKKIMGADDKLTGTEIFAKSALTGLEIGSFLPVGTVVKGTGVLANVSTKVPATLQASKTVAVGNIITRGLGLGDIYQVGKVGAQKGFGKIMEQTVYGQALKATPQALTYAGLGELADDDGVNNYWGSVGTNAIGAFGVTLGLGYGAKVLGSVAQAGVSDISKMAGRTGVETVTDLAGALPMPKEPVKPAPEPQKLLPLPQEAIQATTIVDGKVVNLPPSAYTQPVLDRNIFEPKAQVIGTTTGEPLPNFFEKLGAFDPQETIPMVDITETIKGNNIDFNPDSVLSINATRKAIDDLALLTGNEVGGKKLKINTEDPKYKEVYNNMIKPLVDRINKVDSKVKVPDVKANTFEEFVKEQGEPLYHGTKKNNFFEVFDISKAGTGVGSNVYDQGDRIYLTGNKKAAEFFSILAEKRNILRQGQFPKGSVMGEVLEFNLDKTAKVKIIDNMPRGGQIQAVNDIITQAQNEGYDAIRFKDTGFNTIEGNKKVFNIIKESGLPETTIILNPNKIISKSQLEDIYNQTQATTQPAVEKVPVEDVEMEVNKIYSELENAGINIVPEQVRLTPNIQAVDDKLAKGEIPTPEEFDKGMKEYVNSTGRTEVIDGVQEELTGPMKKSAYAERLKRENPDLNLSSIEYQAAVVKDLEEIANNLIETNFDEAGKIARSINKNSSLQDIKIGELYINKLIELGKNDELAQVYGSFSAEATRSGQRTGILQQKKIGTPQYALKQATDARVNKLKPQIDKEVAKVKQEMSSVVIDQTVIFDILDNITCR